MNRQLSKFENRQLRTILLNKQKIEESLQALRPIYDYIESVDKAHKECISQLNQTLQEFGVDAGRRWELIEDLIVEVEDEASKQSV